jgi:hypothetical protein
VGRPVDVDSFADAITAAIDLGGDTDTVAAVAGGLAGAIHGVAGDPEPVDHLRARTRVTTPDGTATYRPRRPAGASTLRLLGQQP